MMKMTFFRSTKKNRLGKWRNENENEERSARQRKGKRKKRKGIKEKRNGKVRRNNLGGKKKFGASGRPG